MSKKFIKPALTIVGAATGFAIGGPEGAPIGASIGGEFGRAFAPSEGEVPSGAPHVFAPSVTIDLSALSPPILEIARGESFIQESLDRGLSFVAERLADEISRIPKDEAEFWERFWPIIEAVLRDMLRLIIATVAKDNALLRSTLETAMSDLLAEWRGKRRRVERGFAETPGDALGGIDEGVASLAQAIEKVIPPSREVIGDTLEGTTGELSAIILQRARRARPEGEAQVDAREVEKEREVRGGESSPLDFLKAPFRAFAAIITKGVLDQFDKVAEVDPREVSVVAADLLANAALWGVGAHIVALAPELFHPFKHIGLSSTAAMMADFAGFAPVTGALYRARAMAAVGRPAEQMANRVHRSNIPDVRDILQLWVEGQITEEFAKYHLSLHGFSELMIDGMMEAFFRKPTVRELGLIAEDSDLDEAWTRSMLTKQGYNPDDADRILLAVRDIGTKAARGGLVGEAVAAFREGVLDEAGLDENLEKAGVGELNKVLIRRRASLAWAREEAKETIDILVSQVRAGVTRVEELEGLLQALGIRGKRAFLLARKEELRLQVKVVEEERADLRAAGREARRLFGRASEEAFKRGDLSPEQLQSNLMTLGFVPSLAEAMTALAEVRLRPPPVFPRVLTREAEEELGRQALIESILLSVRKGITIPAHGIASLITMGVAPERAGALVELEVVRRQEPSIDLVAEKLTPEEREERRVRVAAVLEAFEAGEISPDGLEERLKALGQTAGVAKAIREREEAKRARTSGRVKSAEAERAGAAKAREERAIVARGEREVGAQVQRRLRLLERATLDSFRKDIVSEEMARANLLVLGLDPALADALVEVERVRAFKPSPALQLGEEAAP